MCVRAPCYIPSSEPSPTDHAERLIGRNNLLTILVEVGALGVFLCTVLIWSSVLSGA